MNDISRVYTGSECNVLDQKAIHDAGIPGIQLMHRAGRFAFEVIQQHWPVAKSITVVCGSGNNAGDGYVVAGLAKEHGFSVQLIQVGESMNLRGDALLAWDWARAQNVRESDVNKIEGSVVVDALLGTGAVGDIRERYVAAIDLINRSGVPVLALDVPSGIFADTGVSLTDRPVRADVTATFVAPKLGLVTGAGVNFAGRVEFSDLGIPCSVYDGVSGLRVLPTTTAERHMPRRQPGHYKTKSGRVVVIGGDLGMGGAPLLSAEAALRTGAGLVTVLTRPEHVPAILARRPELMVRGISEGESITAFLSIASVVAAGPGLGRKSWGYSLLRQSLDCGKPLILDADALNQLAEHDWLPPADSVLTPHPGEAAELLGTSVALVEADRPKSVLDLSSRTCSAVVLKGAGTLIAEDGLLHAVCCVANPVLATAGSGDVLTGVIAAALAQQLPAVTAASLGVWLHAQAGHRVATEFNGKSALATDLIGMLRPFDSGS